VAANARYRELLPHPALRPFVDRFWISVDDAAPPARRILPDGCIDVLIDLGREGRSLVVGTMTSASLFAPRGPVRIAAVRFRPAGAVPFLGVAARELTDGTFTCDDIGARWLARAPWGETTDAAAAAGSLQRLLLGRLAALRRPDPLVAHAVASLFGPAPPSIEALGRQTGWSRQHLARAFHRHVGVSPKQLARVARLQRAVADLQRRRGDGLADAALRLGYFDQAHMARDFRALAGLTPAEARAAAGSIFPIQSLLTGA
jgi:AraC-like DNA-binding protein